VTDGNTPPSAVTKGSSALPKVKNWVSTDPTPLDILGKLFRCRSEGLVEIRCDAAGGLLLGSGASVEADGFEFHGIP
jgi:hypothetical protein